MMSVREKSNTAVLAGSALTIGQVDRARDLLSKGDSMHLQKAGEVLVSSGHCEALKFLINECRLDVNKHNLLHLALLAGQEDIAKFLIVSGADVNQHWQVDPGQDINISWNEYEKMARRAHSGFDRFATTLYLPLKLSINCSVDMVRFLLQSGADVNISFPNGRFRQYGKTTLHKAVYTGNIEKIRLLIDHGADLEAKTVRRETALILACDNPSVGPDCLQLLLEKGATLNSSCVNFLRNMQRAIHLATRRGNTEKLQYLIQYGAHLEARASDGHTALSLACKERVRADCVKILLENGAFPNVITWNQETPLTLARRRDDEEKNQKIRLLKHYGASEEEEEDRGETALMSACQRTGDVESVRHLLENNALANLKDERGNTALHYAADAGDIQKLQVLVRHNSDVNAMDDNGNTPLMTACCDVSVDVEFVQFLLENSALPNLTNMIGGTALHFAGSAGDIQKMKMLVQYGAHVNAVDVDNKTPLTESCYRGGDVDCVRFLLQNKASPNMSDKYGHTALHRATRNGSKEMINLLLQYQADVNAMTEKGETPLMLAIVNSQTDCVRSLLQNNALPNVTDNNGHTALHLIAAERGDRNMINLLAQYKANLNAMTESGETPLMLGCKHGQIDNVRFLLENNALPNLTDKNGRTALHLVTAEREEKEIVDLLLQYQADVNAMTVRGMTPLMLAYDKEYVNLLIEKGALLNLTCQENKTALDYAVDNGSAKTVQLLVKHGATVEPNSLFLAAARNKNVELLELFYKLGADILTVDSTGQNATMLAVRSGESSGTVVLQWLVDNGVSVNQRDSNGWTPLMAAVNSRSFKMAKFLLESGADVHAVRLEGNTEITALDDLLGSRFNSDCVEHLIRNDVVNSFPERYNAFLHKMIMADERIIIVQLLIHGMGPRLCRSRYACLSDRVSPLTVALQYGKFPVIQYLIGNTVLCPCDLNDRFYHSELRARLHQLGRREVIDAMDEFYAQPKSLFQLSFVTVSHTIGGVPGRMDRVNALPLPQGMKDSLLFKTDYVPMDFISDSPKQNIITGIKYMTLMNE